LTARTRTTQITILARSAGGVIIFVTIAMILLGFPAVRHVGATLIASAGLFGLAIGAAAQPALKSLVAGIQIAMTQPIRIGDFVVVDSESGRVEDIRLSYVVVRTGDERRLIIPTTKFLDTTFQNWTRVGGSPDRWCCPSSRALPLNRCVRPIWRSWPPIPPGTSGRANCRCPRPVWGLWRSSW
jgi:small-conductance mechanosensitive channel